MRVLISGAGIAGLTLALLLRRSGHRVLVLERAPALRGEGYMIDFFGPGYDVAARAGLLPQLEAIHHPVRRFVFLDRRGRAKFSLPYPALRRRVFRDRHFNFTRGDLARTLQAAIRGEVEVRFGTTLEGVAQEPDRVAVRLSDGTSEEVELVVGADGVRSATRDLAFGGAERFERYLGYDTAAFDLAGSALRGRLEDAFYTMTVPGRQVAVSPLRRGRLATFFLQRRGQSLADRSPAAVRRELHRAYGDLDWLVPDLLERARGEVDLYYDAVAQVVLPRRSAGRITLVGDACYCVSLLAGQGASLAMAGAAVLAQELAGPGGVAEALARYERRLKPLILHKQRAGRRLARWFAPDSRLRLALRDGALRLALLPGLASLVRRELGAHGAFSHRAATGRSIGGVASAIGRR